MFILFLKLIILAAILLIVFFALFAGSVVAIFGVLLVAPAVFFFSLYKLVVLGLSSPTVRTSTYGGNHVETPVCPKCKAEDSILTEINKRDSLGIKQTYYACSECGHIYVGRTAKELKEQRIQQGVILVVCIILFGIAVWGLGKVDEMDGKKDYENTFDVFRVQNDSNKGVDSGMYGISVGDHVKVLHDDLLVRSLPNVSNESEKLGYANPDVDYTVFEIAVADSYEWYRIADNEWIANNGKWVEKR